MSFEVLRVVDAGCLRVAAIYRPPHPLLVPTDLVHAVVVTTGIGDGDFIEFRMELERAQGILTAGGTAVDTEAADVVVGIFRGSRLVPENAVGKPGVPEVLPGDVVKSL